MTVKIRDIGATSTHFTGADHAVLDAIRTLETKRMRARTGGGWLVPQNAAPDVVALLESRGYAVEVAAV